jgi:hypothetical protein
MERARLIKIPDDVFDPEVREIFADCIGHIFPVGDVSDGLVELEIGELFGRASYMDSIYAEHDCIKFVVAEG